jgi:hypothetical protein
VRRQRHIPRIPAEHLPVDQDRDVPVGRPDDVRPERLTPFVEELAKRVDALHRRLDVHDPVGGVRRGGAGRAPAPPALLTAVTG